MSEVNDTSGGGADDQKAVEELIGFLEPATRLDIRRTALQYVIALSAALDGSAARLFMANDFAMGKCTQLAYDSAKTEQMLANVSARLLTNLSRHFPDRVHQLLGEHDSHVLDVLLEMFLTKLDDSTPSLIGYTLVNLSTLSTVRHRLVESKLYQKICPLTTVEDKKEMAVDILRNLAFEDGFFIGFGISTKAKSISAASYGLIT
ncbi:unnamed protein product [Nippostrongylus brasiliensis]|uniref:Protein HGH1 homolog n=1 Tax=Nippostrongylus brasiliensis TaxID=27835 RepID=A0A0N4YJ42_NIPBR|nr:unnamed protein product [Nippostrongylus brasiliensis]